MSRNQDRNETSADLVFLATRVRPETAEALRAAAERNYRSVSSHIRALIEADVSEPLERAA